MDNIEVTPTIYNCRIIELAPYSLLIFKDFKIFDLNTIKSRIVISLSIFGLFIFIICLLGIELINRATAIREYQNDIAEISNDISRLIGLDLKLINVEYKEPGFYDNPTFAPLAERQLLYRKLTSEFESIKNNSVASLFHLNQDLFVGNKLLKKYDSLQNKLISLKKNRGFKDNALEGKMRYFIHELEAKPGIISSSDILTLRRHEKDYFLRSEEQYIDRLINLSNQLQKALLKIALIILLHLIYWKITPIHSLK